MKKTTRGLPAGILTNESLGEYSYGLDGASVARLTNGDLTPESMERLSEFANWGAALGS